MPIRAVLFDLDDTLFPCMVSIERANASSDAHMQENYPELFAKWPSTRVRGMIFELLHTEHDIAHCFTSLRRRALEVAARDCGWTDGAELEHLVEDCYQAFFRGRQDVDLYDGTIPMLRELKEDYGLKLGAVTNGNAHVHHIEGLKEFFDFQLSPTEAGVKKPHRGIFEQALELLGNPDPDDVVHVGDSYVCDVIGAKRAGLRTIFIKPDEDDHPHPDDLKQSGDLHHAGEISDPLDRHHDAVVAHVGELMGVLIPWLQEK